MGHVSFLAIPRQDSGCVLSSSVMFRWLCLCVISKLYAFFVPNCFVLWLCPAQLSLSTFTDEFPLKLARDVPFIFQRIHLLCSLCGWSMSTCCDFFWTFLLIFSLADFMITPWQWITWNCNKRPFSVRLGIALSLLVRMSNTLVHVVFLLLAGAHVYFWHLMRLYILWQLHLGSLHDILAGSGEAIVADAPIEEAHY